MSFRTTLITYLLLAILICCTLLAILQSYRLEGFEDAALTDQQESYKTLAYRLQTTMADYCDLAAYAQAQMKTIYMAPKPPEVGKTETEAEALAHIKQTYMDVYACKDENALSRPTCSLLAGATTESSNANPSFVPCSAYTLPTWTTADTTPDAAIALRALPDDLPDRIAKELDWYAQIIKKLTDALALGASPPASVPNSPNSPSTSSSGSSWSVEGFENPTCTAAQMQAQVQVQKAQNAQNSPCTMPSIESEITRVNALLDSSTLQNALSKSASLKTSMIKLKSDQEKAAAGTLYPWQQSGPKKSYKSFPTGNRKESLMGSIQQNQ